MALVVGRVLPDRVRSGGVGFRREPQLLLGDGDTVAVELDGVGRIENAMVDEQLSG